MMRKHYYSILVLVLAVFISHPAIAAKCVRPTGNGGCFDNIQDAIDAVNPGGTVKVYPGIYYGNFDADKQGITIQGMGNKRTDVRIDTGGDPFSNHITAASVTVRNLTIQNSSNGIQCTSLAPDNAKVVNVNIFNSTNNGINIISGDDILIKNCKILASGGHGVDNPGGDRLTVQNTTISDCGASGIYCLGNQLTVEGCIIKISGLDLIDVQGSGTTIHNNQLFKAGGGGIHALSDFIKVTENVVKGTAHNGMHISGEGPVVKSNIVMHAQTTGIEIISSGGESKVVNNLSSYNGGQGFSFSSPFSTSLFFKKNKAFNNGSSGIHIGSPGDKMIIENQSKFNTGSGFYVERDGTLENNIASENRRSGYVLNSDNTATQNKAINNMETGFYVQAAFNLLRNNRAIGNLSSGIHLDDSANNNDIINNTMLDSLYDKCDNGLGNTWTNNTYDTECP